MKKIALAALALASLALLPACVNLDKVVAQLKDDPAAVSASVTTVYGSIKFARLGGVTATNVSIVVSPDGSITTRANP